ncbi:hypothetical protein [Yinghuangia sp. YIM S09857]|uniref:hypothetical protein n=1 Tax=Yinghuangia sp. YIM S09857 TaxID=3436929 RepID=UPI003F52F6C4
MTAPTWSDVQAQLRRKGGRQSLPGLFEGLSESERRTLVPELKDAVKSRSNHWGNESVVVPLRVAGAACIGGAAGVSQWLARRDLQLGWKASPNEEVVTVLMQRSPEWIPEIAERLSARLSGEWWSGDWDLVDRLVRVSGAEPPTAERYTLGWFDNHTRQQGRRPQHLVQSLHADPLAPVMLMRLFDVEQIGRAVADNEGWRDSSPERTWTHAFRSLADSGFIDREAVLNACLSRLLRGVQPPDARGFVCLYEALESTEDEQAARTTTYLRLLPDGPSAAVAVVQPTLRALDEAGRLTGEQVAEATRAVLFRPEKKYVRAQFTWLDKAVRRHPDHAADLLAAAATVFTQDASDLHDRALKSIARFLPKLTVPQSLAVRAELRVALDYLVEPGLGVAARLLGEEAAPAVPAAGPELPPCMPRELPPPIASIDELAEELNAFLATRRNSWSSRTPPTDPLAVERLVEALLRESARDRQALADGLRPVVERSLEAGRMTVYGADVRDAYTAVAAMATASIGKGGGQQGWFRSLFGKGEGGTQKPDKGTPGPQHAVVIRLHEVAQRLRVPSSGPYLARPVTATGYVDPAELVHGLEAWEAAGRTPWACDLEQALLRLPREIDADTVARAGKLGSPAGEWAARVMAEGGMPAPEVTTWQGSRVQPLHWWQESGAGQPTHHYRLAAIGPTPKVFADSNMARLLCDLPEGSGHWEAINGYAVSSDMPCWALLAPAHRDVIAAHAAVPLIVTANDHRGNTEILPLLAEADGTPGAGMSLALAYGLGARHPEDRTVAADAYLTLAARTDVPWDASATGATLAGLAAIDRVKTTRVVDSLRQVVTAGAYAATWDLMTGLLPPLLAAERRPAGLGDLLAIAAEAAARSGARGLLPGLEAVAAAKGGSRIVVEGRRLHTVLSAG